LPAGIEPIVKRGPEPAQGGPTEWPRIALVTPVYNSGRYIEQTIRSVLAQGYPNLEYYIVDGGSTDETIEVIRKYEGAISGWSSEPDNGMYDALNKGFARTRGEIMGWISATDQLHLGGLLVVGGVFRDVAEAEWITGRPTWFSEEGMNLGVGAAEHWSRTRFLMGANRYIQQESTFWRRSLWERAGGRVDASRRNGADFELWVRFFLHARLYPVDAIIGGFRKHGDSLGLQDLEACHRVHDEIIEAELEKESGAEWIRRFRRLRARTETMPLGRGLWRRVMYRLYHQRGRDWAPLIAYDGDKWKAAK
jgi:glycosyltransferase involved in cell wall biosynthesis